MTTGLKNKLHCKAVLSVSHLMDLDVNQNVLNNYLKHIGLGETNSCFVYNRDRNNLKCIGKNRHGINDIPNDFTDEILKVETGF